MSIGGGTMWGKESLFEYNGLVMNDHRQENRVHFDTINGIRGADIRETREPVSSDHGEQIIGDVLMGGKTITLAGRVIASDPFMMRYLQDQLILAFDVATELPLKIYSNPLFVYQNLFTTAGTSMAVTAGKRYSAAVTPSVKPSGTARLRIRWRNASNAVIATSTSDPIVVNQAAWISNVEAPPGATNALLELSTDAGSSTGFTASQWFFAPGTHSTYADGETLGWNWVGTRYASASTAMVPVQINCKKITEIDMDDAQTNLRAERDFQIQLRATNPRILSQTMKTLTLTPAAGATTVTGTVRNLGSKPAQARVRVTGPTGTNPKVENLTNGTAEQFLGTWAAGQYIEADTKGRRIYDHTGAMRRSALGGLTRWITLEPGDNSVRLTLASGAVTGVKAEIFHYDTWV